MPGMRPHDEKQSANGLRVTIYQNVHDGSWLVGRRAEPSIDPVPLGGFQSVGAARSWADVHFAGGSWKHLSSY